MTVLAWLGANWQIIVTALVGIDSALIPIFPKAGILSTIKNFLSGL